MKRIQVNFVTRLIRNKVLGVEKKGDAVDMENKVQQFNKALELINKNTID